MLARRSLLLLCFFLLVGARQRPARHPAEALLSPPPRDIFTFSQPSEVAVRHVALDLTVDFTSRRLTGTATLEIRNLTGARTLVLDTDDLTIARVTLDGTTPVLFSVSPDTPFGSPLTIPIRPETRSVQIDYSTSSTAAGLFWNTPAQSYGRQQPYLYSLNEPVGARSWIPIQDTPAARITYSARVHVPRGLLALMSASNNPRAVNESGTYSFDMPYRIPAYLIAIAVGRLEFHEFDERTGVYAEPELLADAAWELQYLPEMMDVTERIAGPFPFARHDVLLMPPTFVVGGMEHPMLNFVAPFNLVTKNRPPIPQPHSLIAHELAHSWAGDLTTLATWNDVWLNEGITSYLTWRILEEMSGAARAELGWHLDRQNYSQYAVGAEPKATMLHLEVSDPDSGFSFTGYVKGALFIKTLEDLIGREPFDAFMRRYFQAFAYRWVDDKSFLAFLDQEVIRGSAELRAQLQADEWIYGSGVPSNITAPQTSALLEQAIARAQAFERGTAMTNLGASAWTDLEKDLFLQSVFKPTLRTRMAEVDAALRFNQLETPPLTWLVQSVDAQYAPAMPAVERALMRGGPGSWITSLYTALARSGGRERGQEIFSRARERYRDDIQRTVASILGLQASAEPRSPMAAALSIGRPQKASCRHRLAA